MKLKIKCQSTLSRKATRASATSPQEYLIDTHQARLLECMQGRSPRCAVYDYSEAVSLFSPCGTTRDMGG